MIAPLGRLLILLSLFLAAAGAVVGFAVSRRYSATGWAWTRRLAYAYAAAISLANGLMIYALLAHDFSVGYVAQVGSRATPTWVTIVSLWSSLDGSLLFWGLVLGAYVAAATYSIRDRHPEYMPQSVAVWLGCATFFSFTIISGIFTLRPAKRSSSVLPS